MWCKDDKMIFYLSFENNVYLADLKSKNSWIVLRCLGVPKINFFFLLNPFGEYEIKKKSSKNLFLIINCSHLLDFIKLFELSSRLKTMTKLRKLFNWLLKNRDSESRNKKHFFRFFNFFNFFFFFDLRALMIF